ncbi:MAG: nucleotidyltransferase family protein [Pseudomonadota bacterium]
MTWQPYSRRFAGLDARRQEEAAREIILGCPPLMRTLRTLRETGLPDAWLVSGALYGNIWNTLTGRACDHGVKDYDILYFDPDTSYEAEDAVIRRWTPAFAVDPPHEIRNQARVHLWYEAHFGQPYAPLSETREAIRRFASTTHAIGARLNPKLEIYAPYGLDDIFSLRLAPNTRLENHATHERKARRQMAAWPELTFVPWPDAVAEETS